MITTDTRDVAEYRYANKLNELIDGMPCSASESWGDFEKRPTRVEVIQRMLSDPTLKPQLHQTMLIGGRILETFGIGEEIIANLDCSRSMRYISLQLFGNDQIQLEKILERLSKYMDTLMVEKEDHSLIGITFSYMTGMGPAYFFRNIACPEWSEIQANYVDADKITWLLNLKEPDKHGKLIFWHGVPGTGKTYCIRTLMRNWRHKADFIYVLDPEHLFGDPGYLLNTLMHEPYHAHYDAEDGELKDPEPEGSRLKVLVIEDALDLLLKENRKQKSSAMARLLNLTEGIVGQGFRVLVLITSNEEIKTIDSAFTRVGRCLQVLEFKPFGEETGFNWLKSRGYDVKGLKTRANWTLADLYSVLKDAEFSMSSSILEI